MDVHIIQNSNPVKKFQRHALKGDKLIELQEDFERFRANPSQCYIVIDEMSQIGEEMFNWLFSSNKFFLNIIISPLNPFCPKHFFAIHFCPKHFFAIQFFLSRTIFRNSLKK